MFFLLLSLLLKKTNKYIILYRMHYAYKIRMANFESCAREISAEMRWKLVRLVMISIR